VSNFVDCPILGCGQIQEGVRNRAICKDEYQYMLKRPEVNLPALPQRSGSGGGAPSPSLAGTEVSLVIRQCHDLNVNTYLGSLACQENRSRSPSLPHCEHGLMHVACLSSMLSLQASALEQVFWWAARLAHNAPALSHTTRTDEADNWPFYMAS